MISVCLLSYNGETYIKDQINSILNELEKEDELIISDDGSSDDTIPIIKEIKDSRIKLLHHFEEHSNFKGTMRTCFNVGRNAENALKIAKGDYIFLSDQDDIWLPGKTKECLNILQSSDLVITNHIPVDRNLNEIYTTKNKGDLIKPTIWNTFIHTQFLGCCMAFRKKLLPYILPFPKEPLMHDIWIGLMALKYGKISLIRKPLLLYRRHGKNASINIEGKSTNSLGFKLMYRYYILKAYING